MTAGCGFCRIAEDPSEVVVLHAGDDLLVFLDHMPLRPGHCMIVTRAHHPYFDDVPAVLAARAMTLAQRIARAMKATHAVERVAVFATGSDIAQAHLHIAPMHDRTDLTSVRYMAVAPVFGAPRVASRETPAAEAARLTARLEVTE